MSIIVVLEAVLFFLPGCVPEPVLDKGKFAELDRAGQDLKAALRSGGRCEVPDAVVQRLASETAAVRDRTATKAERDLLAAYENLVTVSRDALLLCRSRTHLSGFQFLPKGRIFVSQDLDPIVERYGLPVERHVYRPTGAVWKSISEDAIQELWEKAEVQLQNIEVVLKYG